MLSTGSVTLPWKQPDGDPVTFKLIVTRPDGRPWRGPAFDQANWYPAQEKAGITPARRPGERRKAAAIRACTCYGTRPPQPG